MITINLIPQVRDDTLELVRSGDTLTINGDSIDLSVIPDGATLPSGAIDNAWIFGPTSRIDGMASIAVFLPIAMGSQYATAFPPPIINPPDGPIAIPGQES